MLPPQSVASQMRKIVALTSGDTCQGKLFTEIPEGQLHGPASHGHTQG
jgi:hypothetical protein